MRKKPILYFALLLLFTSSCQKVIDLKVNDSDPKLVIEANYDAVAQKVQVHISKSIGVFSSDTFPVITNAQVDIIDGIGVVSPLINKGEGNYALENYVPVYNNVYRVVVIIKGKTYTASDSLVPVVPIDTITQEKLPPNPIADDGYAIYVHFTDPPNENFYRIRINKNGKWQHKLNDQFLLDDHFFNGNVTQFPLLPSVFSENDTVQLRMLSYSKKAYDYFSALFALAGSSTSSPAPSNPPASWTNDALGTFTAYGYDTMKYVIHH